jgi:hypothetical protein
MDLDNSNIDHCFHCRDGRQGGSDKGSGFTKVTICPLQAVIRLLKIPTGHPAHIFDWLSVLLIQRDQLLKLPGAMV